MPKYSREMEDKIIAAFEQGKRNSVISRELRCDRGALPKRRKEWEKRKQDKSIDLYTKELGEKTKPADPLALPIQISKLEKRMNELEESQQGSNPSLDALLLKRIKKLEKAQRGSNTSSLEKRMSIIEESQRVGVSIRNNSITDFEKVSVALIASAKRRQWEHLACKQITPKGYCRMWFYEKDEISEYIRPVARGEHEGRKVYYINVRENPLICSACPVYESNG